MKLFFLIFACSFILSKYAYGDDCQNTLSRLVNESEIMITDVGKNLRSSRFQDRLKGLRAIKEINPDGDHIYLEILPLIQDPHPQVQIETAKVLQQSEFQGSVYLKIIYLLYFQLQRERDVDVSDAINEAVDALNLKYSRQVHRIGEKIKKHIQKLNFSVEKAEHIIDKLNIQPEQWLKITKKALITDPEDQTITEQMSLEIFKEITAVEDDFKDMIRTLPFKNSLEFFHFTLQYHKFTGGELRMRKQAFLIIKSMYLLL